MLLSPEAASRTIGNGGGALGGAELLARRALLTAALLECLLRLLLLQLLRLRGALHHDLPADPDPLSPYRVSGHFRFDSAISAVGRGRGLHMRTVTKPE